MREINKVAVIGSGVMGSGIAAQLANAGVEVLMLDIVPEGADNRNALCEGAVAKALKAKPAPFSSPKRAKNITCGNLEDSLDQLKEVDWIIEVIIERLDIKQSLYKKLDAVRKPGSIVSSNTSTLPLQALEADMPDSFRKDFFITHFFNPPRYMGLLELVTGPKSDPDAADTLRRFCDVRLGKGVVDCKDTPGFIANRIGVYWLMVGLLDAIEMGITVEEADAVMGKPVGIPKTGVFGLFDLIGIDLMPLIAKAMLTLLPKEDAFCQIYHEPELVGKMIEDGYTGRKGKGGFYRLNKQDGKKIKEALNLKTGEYHPAHKPKLQSVEAAKSGLAALVSHPDIGGRYARSVLLKVLHYAASLIPEISDDIASVDAAMRLGYNWKYGPFALIDRLGVDVFARALEEEGLEVPEIIRKAEGRPLYTVENNRNHYLSLQGDYTPLTRPQGQWLLREKTLGSKPVLKNGSARLWDIGDGIACLEFTSKMNSIDPDILALMGKSVEEVSKNFKGLVIGGDADNFSVGANLGFFLYVANTAAWNRLSDVITQGQQAMMALKYAPFPVVGALHGMALGGGCETILHCDAVNAHLESYPGLVEVGVGVIPGWGGCKEMVLRHANNPKAPGGSMPAVAAAFEAIALAKVGTSYDEAKQMRIVTGHSRLTMNRFRLLEDAKQLCLQLAEDYAPPQPATIALPGPSGKAALEMTIDGFMHSGKATEHDAVIARHLATVLTGGDADPTVPVTEQAILDLEHDAFMELVKLPKTLARIEYMLANNKPLRN